MRLRVVSMFLITLSMIACGAPPVTAVIALPVPTVQATTAATTLPISSQYATRTTSTPLPPTSVHIEQGDPEAAADGPSFLRHASSMWQIGSVPDGFGRSASCALLVLTRNRWLAGTKDPFTGEVLTSTITATLATETFCSSLPRNFRQYQREWSVSSAIGVIANCFYYGCADWYWYVRWAGACYD